MVSPRVTHLLIFLLVSQFYDLPCEVVDDDDDTEVRIGTSSTGESRVDAEVPSASGFEEAAADEEEKAAENAAREADEKEAAREAAEIEEAEEAAREAAERAAGETAEKEEATREAVEEAAREAAEKESAERSARETAEKEAAEKAAREVQRSALPQTTPSVESVFASIVVMSLLLVFVILLRTGVSKKKPEADTFTVLLEPGTIGWTRSSNGVVIAVEDGQQAQKKGVKLGMQITSVAGKAYSNAAVLEAAAGTQPYKVVVVKAASSPAPVEDKANTVTVILEPGTIGWTRSSAGFVQTVEDGQQAQKKGIQPGMQITSVAGKEYSTEAVRAASTAFYPYEVVLMKVPKPATKAVEQKKKVQSTTPGCVPNECATM